MTHLSLRFFSIVKRSSIHKLHLGFVNFYIAPIGLIYLTTLSDMHLRRSVHDVVYLKCCSKWAANESDFFQFLKRRNRLEK